MSNDNPYASDIMQGKKLVREEDVLSDIAEIYNHLIDDLDTDEEEALSRYKTKDLNKAKVKAIKRFTFQMVKRKFKKYGGKGS